MSDGSYLPAALAIANAISPTATANSTAAPITFGMVHASVPVIAGCIGAMFAIRGTITPPGERLVPRATPMDDESLDTFDDLFEPFGLGEDPNDGTGEPPGRTRREPISVSSNVPPEESAAPRGSITCASCGSPNDPANRHCDRCGARIVKSQMPVAPQPLLRTTAGARALIVLAGVVLLVAMLALVFNAFSGSDDPADAATTTVGSTAATTPIAALTPFLIQCTSDLPSFPCEALIDGDPATSWNATEGGINVEITFFFNPAVQITEMIIENVDSDERFLRNRRIKGIEVRIDDLQQVTVAELADSNDEAHRIQIRSLQTSSVVVRITSAYPGQSYDGKEPFPELAVQEITFYGRPSPTSTPGTTTSP